MARESASAAAAGVVLLLVAVVASGARLPGGSGGAGIRGQQQQQPRGGATATAVFALGSFWRSEAAFGCLPGVIRTSVGYAGGSKASPEYRNLGDHAECVKVEYDPRLIHYNKLLDVFWASHDPREVFGQGPDVGNQYRSIIFTNGTIEARLAALSKEKEQAKDRQSVITTQIQPIGTFYLAEPEHQKFELKRKQFLLQLIGNLPEEELLSSTQAAKLNAYAAELCPTNIQNRINSKIDEIAKKGWPILREI
ncbi:peptide methionine sulfoxide reductase A5 [Oryza brachyantha]|uniref:peptide methionine sulfoxide reductase A5 n=1 Tax=Oryza brachyantha TaxID=4533 RepID=UPI001ADC3B25|nr:peptide methionine sulfoxide reductase A5 [Oryza brachyantha]